MKLCLSVPILLSACFTFLSFFYAEGNDVAITRSPKAHELTSTYTFQQYLLDFDKPMIDPNSQEYQIKKVVFESNLEMILNHNQNVIYDLETGEMKGDRSDDGTGHTFHMGINHFMEYSIDEFKSKFLGYDKSLSSRTGRVEATATSRKMKEAHEDSYELDLPFNITDVSTLPSSFRYTKVTPVKNQGGCGSCWSFSSIAALEGHLAKETGELDVLSTEELLTCVNNPNQCGGTGGCNGGTAELAYSYIAKHGILKEESFAYTGTDDLTCPLEKDDEASNNHLFTSTKLRKLRHHKHSGKKSDNDESGDKKRNIVAKVRGYAKLPTNSYKGLMNAVAKHSPVVIAAAASTWMFYEGGVFSPDKSNPDAWDLNHGIVVEGYGTDETSGDDYWLVRNSWGQEWGENGYIRLKRVDPDKIDDSSSECGVDSTPLDGVACKFNADGSKSELTEMKVCGTSGLLADPVIPVGGFLV